MAKINSDTSNVNGVSKIQQLVEKELRNFKFNVKKIPNPLGKNVSAPLIVGEIAGTINKYITLVCHADTVFGKNQSHEVSYEQNKVYGPGIVDNKGGIIVALSGLEKYLQEIKSTSNSTDSSKTSYGLRFVCSPNEEKGSTGWHEIFKKYSQDSIAVLGLEPAFKEGDVITSRKGNRWYDVTIKGKKAHSGREHHLGVNACSELAIQLAKLQNLTDYQKELTVNIGKIAGGQGHNIVSDYAYGQIEVRYPCHVTQRFITSKVEKSLSQNFIQTTDGLSSTDINYDIVDDCPPMATNKSSLKLFKEYQKIIKQIEDKTISSQSVGGAADVNHFSTPEQVILDGLGPIGGGMHTDKEFIQVDSLHTRAVALNKLLFKLQQGVLK